MTWCKAGQISAIVFVYAFLIWMVIGMPTIGG